MYKYKAIISTGEILEADCFKTVYRAALRIVQYDLEEEEMHTATIEVDGEEKYRITPMMIFYDARCIGKSIDVVRLTDWACITARSMPGINQRARWCVDHYLGMCIEPPTKKELEDLIHRVANRYAKTRKDYDRISEELNKYILSVV